MTSGVSNPPPVWRGHWLATLGWSALFISLSLLSGFSGYVVHKAHQHALKQAERPAVIARGIAG